MALIDDDIAAELRKAFAGLSDPVQLVHFSERPDDAESSELRELLGELAALEPRLTLEPRVLEHDAARATELGVERAPAIAILGRRDYGVRFYGLPGGYEFGALVEAVLDVSRGDSGLSAPTREALAALAGDVHIRVFSTPT